jgi:hypothetical protein
MAQEITDPVAEVNWESEHITYRSIWHAANVLKQAGDKDEDNGFWSLMAATVLVHAAFEGFVNDLIERLYPHVWKDEAKLFRSGDHRGTMGKTKFLAERLGVRLNRTSRPYRTVAELQSWRNDLVHPATVRLHGTTRADAYARKPRRAAPVAFTKLARPTFVPRCFEDVSTLADLLLHAVAAEHLMAVRNLGDSAFWGPLGSGGAHLRN